MNTRNKQYNRLEYSRIEQNNKKEEQKNHDINGDVKGVPVGFLLSTSSLNLTYKYKDERTLKKIKNGKCGTNDVDYGITTHDE